ncbi:MAG: hypothetical protein RQ826_10860, partial [Xanthomonadales bacterium]|nr:hypothetical protein [Xanthomonadales bacterium]
MSVNFNCQPPAIAVMPATSIRAGPPGISASAATAARIGSRWPSSKNRGPKPRNTFPAERHEQGHGADGNQAAEIVEDVSDVKTGLVFGVGGKKGPEAFGLLFAEHALVGGLFEQAAVDL